ncbi:MAG: ATP-binding protein, partial [Oscillospiraceae bacterium]|nr:ATP-binding protein [Oscillospiraceae bacterium]
DGLHTETGEKINPQTTLLVFDEVQETPKALSALKYFYENAPEYAIVAAGSLLGVALHKGTSFPVGKVDIFHLYPLSFREFLEGIGEEQLAELLLKKDWELIAAFATKFTDLLRKYYYVGGMPEAVAEYAESKDYAGVRRIHEQILFTYEQDFSKHAPINVVPRINNIWNSVPAQLSRENKRFSPGVVQKGSRLSDYELALQWLLDCGLLYKVNQVSKPSVPLASYKTNFFKIFMHDVGLLSTKSELDVKTLLEGNRIFTEFKGALTEQYVLQELVANGITPFYWSSSGTAEVDFVFKHDSDVFPLEVKSEENLQSKSLKVYGEKYSPPVSLRTSMRGYRRESQLTNVPLYAIGTDFLNFGAHSSV